MTLEAYVDCWSLQPDGEPFRSLSSDLVFVRDRGRPAVLKVPFNEEERFGGILMTWWAGRGAAELYRLEPATGAMVLERATGIRDLAATARQGLADEAMAILAGVAGVLHEPRAEPRPPGLIRLEQWFEALPRAARERGGLYRSAMEVLDGLLRSERELVVLHGDLHHGNALDFGARGWLAIDPKHLFGERTFDYVTMLRNPDWETPPDPEIYLHHVDLAASLSGLDRDRLLLWSYSFAALSAAWIAEDGDHPAGDLAVATITARALGVGS